MVIIVKYCFDFKAFFRRFILKMVRFLTCDDFPFFIMVFACKPVPILKVRLFFKLSNKCNDIARMIMIIKPDDIHCCSCFFTFMFVVMVWIVSVMIIYNNFYYF